MHPFAIDKPDHPEVLAITHDAEHPGRENGWHSDVTWRLQPSLGSILRCVECPAVGGDTLFADMYAADDGLPQRIKELVEGRVARRFTWAPNSIAFSDNRACQHDATSDYWPHVRCVERVPIVGDPP